MCAAGTGARLALLVMIGVALGSPAALADAHDPACSYRRMVALVVGIDTYGPGINPLRSARADAERVAQALRDRGFARVITLLDEQATRGAIRHALGDDLLPSTAPEDLVVVYHAGHGVTVGSSTYPMGYIMPADGDPLRPVSTGISMREITDLLEAAPARHRMFIADACYAGLALPGERRIVARRPPRGAQCPGLLEPVTSVIVGGRADEVAHEDGEGGVFTRALLKGLSGAAAAAGEEDVSQLDLGAYVARVVPRETRRRWGRSQRPQSVQRGPGIIRLPVKARASESARAVGRPGS